MENRENNSGPGLLQVPLEALDDPEGAHVPAGFPSVVDGHVHLFPDSLFDSVWRWFDRHGWPVRYKMSAENIIDFLTSRGVSRIIALLYAHKPGLAAQLNAFMADICRKYPAVTGMATVFPGEDNAAGILEEAFAAGLAGVKLHCHVQCFEIEGPAMQEIYRVCERHRKPLIMHVGREPKSPAYDCDPYLLCSADRVERVLQRCPDLRVCAPHLGADEFDAYRRLLETHDNLWLDTTMTLADYLPLAAPVTLKRYRMDRIIYGTDFPNIPYAWDRELKRLAAMGFSDDELELILGKNAMDFYGMETEKVRR